jgi:hypothetical protein
MASIRAPSFVDYSVHYIARENALVSIELCKQAGVERNSEMKCGNKPVYNANSS